VILFLAMETSKKRRYWVYPINVSNICSSTSVVANELHSDPDKFKTFYCMSKTVKVILII